MVHINCIYTTQKKNGERVELKDWLETQHSKNLRSWHPVPSLHGKEKRKKWKQWQVLFSWAPKSLWTVHDCSHKIERCLLLGRKAMTNLDSILKIRDIILLTKVLMVKAMVFPVVIYGCEIWTIKKAESWRNDVFNCGVGEDSWESHGLQGDQISQS